MLSTLTELLDDRTQQLYECRLCGTALSASDETCSNCGSAEIAHYEW